MQIVLDNPLLMGAPLIVTVLEMFVNVFFYFDKYLVVNYYYAK